MGILDRLALTNQPTPDLLRGTFEAKKYEARMIQQAGHSRVKRSETKVIAGAQLGWTRTMFGWREVVPLAKHNRGKTSHCLGLERRPADEADFDGSSGRAVDAGEARRQSCCVVSDHNVSCT
jgi:hypothetical protein